MVTVIWIQDDNTSSRQTIEPLGSLQIRRALNQVLQVFKKDLTFY